MSDDIVAKMKAAADAAIQSATPAEEEAPAEEVTETTLAAKDEEAGEAAEAAEGTEDGPEETEAPAEEEEEVPPTRDIAEEILAVRQAADRRIRQAEARARELEAKLEKAQETVDMSKKQLVDELFRKLRRAPARTFKEYGFDFQDLIDAGMREGQFHDAPFSEIDELKQQMSELRQERERMQREHEERQHAQMLQQARQQFLGEVSAERFPTLFNLFQDDPEPLWQEAQRIAERHEEQHGEAPDDIDVIRHLESKYKTRLERLNGKVTAAPAGTPNPPKKGAPKTITTKAASETRTAGKPFGQLSSDEQKAALLAAVKKATSQATN